MFNVDTLTKQDTNKLISKVSYDGRGNIFVNLTNGDKLEYYADYNDLVLLMWLSNGKLITIDINSNNIENFFKVYEYLSKVIEPLINAIDEAFGKTDSKFLSYNTYYGKGFHIRVYADNINAIIKIDDKLNLTQFDVEYTNCYMCDIDYEQLFKNIESQLKSKLENIRKGE